jgi:hypothetical protein
VRDSYLFASFAYGMYKHMQRLSNMLRKPLQHLYIESVSERIFY